MEGEQMVVKNGCERKEMVPTDFCMRSVDSRRIVLPFTGKLWGDVYYEALDTALNTMLCESAASSFLYEDYVRDTAMRVFFNIQKRVIHTIAFLRIETTCGTYINRKIQLETSTQEVLKVLAPFFDADCPGLDESFRVYYRNVYDGWSERRNFLRLIS